MGAKMRWTVGGIALLAVAGRRRCDGDGRDVERLRHGQDRALEQVRHACS